MSERMMITIYDLNVQKAKQNAHIQLDRIRKFDPRTAAPMECIARNYCLINQLTFLHAWK